MSQFNFSNFGPGSGGNTGSGGGFGGGFFDQFYSLYGEGNADQLAAQQGFQPVPGEEGRYFRRSDTGGPFAGPTTYRTADQFVGNPGYNQGRAQYAAALLADYQNLLAAGEQQGQRMDSALADMRQAYTGGAENIRMSGQQAFEDLSARSDQIADMGNQFLADQTEFNKGVLERSDQLFEDAIDEFQNNAASDASSMALGIARQRNQQRSQLDAAAKMGDPQAQAALSQMDFQTSQQTQQTMSSLATQYNQTTAQMGMARAQNYGQVGMAAASNINQAGALRNQLINTSASMFQQGVVMRQSAEAMANQFLATGMERSFEAVAKYPRSPVSIAAIFSNLFALDMTPGTSGLTGMPSSYLEAIT